MKKTYNILFLTALFAILFSYYVSLSLADANNYTSKRILLGEYRLHNDKAISSTHSIRWWELEAFNIAIDDNKNIYILDIYNKRVLKLKPDGSLINKISLKDINFPYADRSTEDGYMDYMIQVSSDGKYLYVTGGSEVYSWYIFDSNGLPVRKNISILSNFNRICGNKFVTESDVLDSQLNIIKHVTDHVYAGEIFDSAFNFYSLNQKNIIVKRSNSRQEIWKQGVTGYSQAIRFIGVDVEDNIYVLMGSPLGIAKLSKTGKLFTSISLPNNLIYSNENIRKGIFRVLCDGNIYYFPPYIPIWQSITQKGKGEYSIFKFEKETSHN